MTCIGLTGGIGSGKTIVARIFETMSYPVYYTDKEAKRIMSESAVVSRRLKDRFGEDIYTGRELNRKRLAEIIFTDKESMTFINAVVHPEVKHDFIQWKEANKAEAITLVESAILFETGFDQLVDTTVTVTAPLEIRIKRVMQRDLASRESVLHRIESQMPEEERIILSQHVIVNDDFSPLLPQVESIISRCTLIGR